MERVTRGRLVGLRMMEPPRRWARALYRDKPAALAAVFIVVVSLAAIFAPVLSPYDPREVNLRDRNIGPTLGIGEGRTHLLGADQLGRDELTRLMHAGRISLIVGLSSALISGTIGTLLGLLSGFYRGWLDDMLMRLVDIQMGFPTLLGALLVLYVLGGSFVNLVLVLALARWMVYARVTRAIVFSMREEVFVDAARAIGCSNRRIIFWHMVPNLLSPIVTLGSLEIARVILAEASLSFLGLGIQAPQASWGLMLAQGRDYISSAWWLIAFPGFAIFLTALSINLVATWLRAVTDPVHRAKWLPK